MKPSLKNELPNADNGLILKKKRARTNKKKKAKESDKDSFNEEIENFMNNNEYSKMTTVEEFDKAEEELIKEMENKDKLGIEYKELKKKLSKLERTRDFILNQKRLEGLVNKETPRDPTERKSKDSQIEKLQLSLDFKTGELLSMKNLINDLKQQVLEYKKKQEEDSKKYQKVLAQNQKLKASQKLDFNATTLIKMGNKDENLFTFCFRFINWKLTQKSKKSWGELLLSVLFKDMKVFGTAVFATFKNKNFMLYTIDLEIGKKHRIKAGNVCWKLKDEETNKIIKFWRMRSTIFHKDIKIPYRDILYAFKQAGKKREIYYDKDLENAFWAVNHNDDSDEKILEEEQLIKKNDFSEIDEDLDSDEEEEEENKKEEEKKKEEENKKEIEKEDDNEEKEDGDSIYEE